MKILDVFKKKVPASKGKVVIGKKEFKKEHKELVRILKTGSKAEQNKEANEQAKELKKVGCSCKCGKCNSLKNSNKKCTCSCKDCKRR